MSSSNTDLPSNNEITAKVALSSDNAETEEADLQQVATLVKAHKDLRASVASYEAMFKAVTKNRKSRDAFMKAMMDDIKLSPSMVADLPKAINITSDYIKAAGNAPSGIEKDLTPPLGTRGFTNQVYQIPGTNWVVDVYAYRHANSRDVTVIVLHSGSLFTHSPYAGAIFIAWPNLAIPYKSHHPATYDSEVGDNRYSYHIEYAHNINMIGPDGKNPIVFRAIYKETFTTRYLETRTKNPDYVEFVHMGSGQIYGMSVFNTSFDVGSSMYISFIQYYTSQIGGAVYITV